MIPRNEVEIRLRDALTIAALRIEAPETPLLQEAIAPRASSVRLPIRPANRRRKIMVLTGGGAACLVALIVGFGAHGSKPAATVETYAMSSKKYPTCPVAICETRAPEQVASATSLPASRAGEVPSPFDQWLRVDSSKVLAMKEIPLANAASDASSNPGRGRLFVVQSGTVRQYVLTHPDGSLVVTGQRGKVVVLRASNGAAYTLNLSTLELKRVSS